MADLIAPEALVCGKGSLTGGRAGGVTPERPNTSHTDTCPSPAPVGPPPNPACLGELVLSSPPPLAPSFTPGWWGVHRSGGHKGLPPW